MGDKLSLPFEGLGQGGIAAAQLLQVIGRSGRVSQRANDVGENKPPLLIVKDPAHWPFFEKGHLAHLKTFPNSSAKYTADLYMHGVLALDDSNREGLWREDGYADADAVGLRDCPDAEAGEADSGGAGFKGDLNCCGGFDQKARRTLSCGIPSMTR